MAEDKERSTEPKVDRFVRRQRMTAEESAWQAEQQSVQNEEQEQDPEKAFLKDAARRAHDEELAALANLALVRSFLHGRDDGFPGRRKDSPIDLDNRLRRILDESDDGQH